VTFEQAHLQIGQLLKIPGIMEEKANVKQLVKTRLSQQSTGPWLLIVDNADDIEMLYQRVDEEPPLVDYLPGSPQGSIIFTTRNRKAAVKLAGNNIIEVSEMNQADAKAVLEKSLRQTHLLDEYEPVNELLELLTYLPLAIVQAVAYINENDISISEYVAMYKRNSEKDIIEVLSEDFEDQTRYRDMENPIATTWLISFEQVRRQDLLALEYLSFMACLTQENIPQSLLLPGASRNKEVKAIGTLTAYSFITKRVTGELFDMHRLVYLATRNWLRSQNQLSIWADKALIRLADVIPPGGHRGRTTWIVYLPHALHVTTSSDSSEEKIGVKIDLLDKIGRCQFSIGQYKVAEGTHRRSLELRKKVLGKEHPHTLTSMNEIGLALSRQGNYAQAEEMHRQTLELREKVSGKEYPETLTSMSNLAQVLGDQGKYAEAEEMHRRTLEMREKVLGKEHLQTLISMNDIGQALFDQGKYAEAEEMHRRALELDKKVLGEEHEETLVSMNNLAGVLNRPGKYEEAEDMNRRTLELRERVLGKEHPDTLMSIYWLAYLLQKRKRYDSSSVLYQRALLGYQKKLGLDHPTTLACSKHYSSLVEEMK
jgi:tetratricopeptide (TPR) repeat protein